ncbi:MAG TPA: M13 family metallopeptidase N-terminal domain-containing protein, partial [Candidatus Limnocylindrales bacterium]|nr:M13 family metallopeptidase N-terminal domain-containing protein [Candidatus Limnocylindrales bacterium]
MSKRIFPAACILAVIGVLAVAVAGTGLRAAGGVDQPASWGFDTANLDKTCKPCDDFYQFAMGGWMKSNPIPPEYPSWGTFAQLADKNQQNLRQILDEAMNAKAKAGSNEQKIGDFYASCMDTAAIEAAGTGPLEPELARIAGLKSVSDLQAAAEFAQSRGVGVLFRFNSTQDAKDSTQVMGAAFQGGLGLPEREYYLKADDKSKQLREAYTIHVAKMLELLGDSADQSAAEAATVLRIETALATASMKNTDLRDPDKTYHKMKLAELKTLTPNFSWEAYFKAVGHPELQEINVGQPDFFKALDALLTATPVDDWKTYLRWHVVNSAAPGLPERFVAEDFDFSGKTLTGAKQIQPRWKRCVQATDRTLGEALGQVYVQKYFPPEAKARALGMVQNLIAALRDDLLTLPWMGPETRAQATAKLAAFALKIGYTDKWRDYSALKIDRRSYAENQT